jgi:hypothetical protein
MILCEHTSSNLCLSVAPNLLKITIYDSDFQYLLQYLRPVLYVIFTAPLLKWKQKFHNLNVIHDQALHSVNVSVMKH